MAVGELRRFSQKFGAGSLLDRESARYRETGIAYLLLDDDETFDRLVSDQRLLNLPLTRAGRQLSVGIDEEAWRGIVAALVDS